MQEVLKRLHSAKPTGGSIGNIWVQGGQGSFCLQAVHWPDTSPRFSPGFYIGGREGGRKGDIAGGVRGGKKVFAFLPAKIFLCEVARAILFWRKNLDLFIASKLPFLAGGWGGILNNVSKEKILFKLSEGMEFVYGGLDNEVKSKVKVQPALLSPALETNFF